MPRWEKRNTAPRMPEKKHEDIAMISADEDIAAEEEVVETESLDFEPEVDEEIDPLDAAIAAVDAEQAAKDLSRSEAAFQKRAKELAAAKQLEEAEIALRSALSALKDAQDQVDSVASEGTSEVESYTYRGNSPISPATHILMAQQITSASVTEADKLKRAVNAAIDKVSKQG